MNISEDTQIAILSALVAHQCNIERELNKYIKANAHHALVASAKRSLKETIELVKIMGAE